MAPSSRLFCLCLFAMGASARSFQCGGAISSAPPFECVGDRLTCDDNDDCSVNCYDSFGDSRAALCGRHDPGCCNTFVQCGANSVCSISCSYSCRNMVIDATSSDSLIVSDCTGSSCANLTVYCPANGQSNSCQLHSESNADIVGLQIYVQSNHEHNVNITHNGSISGQFHCAEAANKQCSLDPSNPLLCAGNVSLECGQHAESNTSKRVEAAPPSLMANQHMQQRQELLWKQAVAASIGLTVIAGVCMFACCKLCRPAQKEESESKPQQRKQRVFSNTDAESREIDQDQQQQQESEAQDEPQGTRRVSQFQQSLSVQIQNQQEIMEDVIRQIRSDSQVADFTDPELEEMQTDFGTPL